VRIAAFTRPLPGETHNGDAFFLARLDSEGSLKDLIISKPDEPHLLSDPEVVDLGKEEVLLLAAIDGVGHGREAAAITAKIISCLSNNYHLDLVSLVRKCHETARYSRGAAIGIGLLDRPKSQISYIGVGNVEMQVSTSQKKKMFINNNGLLGHNVPATLQTKGCAYFPGDVIAVTSDGIDKRFSIFNALRADSFEAGSFTESVIADFGLERDDATVIVAR
jgi:hypothetical protein